MTEFYEEVVLRANAEWHDLLSRLSPSCSPFMHEFQFAWVCNEDVFDYIYHTHQRDIVVSEDFSSWTTARKILYRGLPVRIRTYWEDCHNQSPMVVAIVLKGEEAAEYTARYHLDWFPVGTKVLQGNYLLEVMEAGRHHALTTIGMALDYQWYMASHFIGRQMAPNDNKTDISYGNSRGSYSDSSLFSNRNWEMDDIVGRTRRDPKRDLCDNFESADLSILFG